MPSLISTTERAILTGIFVDIFDTFQRRIVVYKEPVKTLRTTLNANNLIFGFGESQTEDAFSYSEVTGVFPAVIRYATQDTELEKTSSVRLSEGEVSIKVKRDCRDFINTGKTEKFVFDDKTFLLMDEERKQTFLDSEFFIFKLKTVK